MERLRRFILESAFTEKFSRAVYEAIGILEAVNINKDFLLREAGSPGALRDAKQRVADRWKTAGMDGVVRGNLQQKLFNFLYLMEIRRPGFVDADLLTKLHDIAIHGSLEQKFLSKVNSDTKPEEAAAILGQAVESAIQNQKPYPSLSAEEEKVWNRVKVYHEFPDGFRWVYALNESGAVAGYLPSTLTDKTMHHCGNQPSCRTGDEYWELRDSTGKAYLTVILNGGGEIEESKSWGNQPNKYRQQILPYVKWLLKDRKVTGVGPRYNLGYATHMNFGVKDFIGDDPEFVDYVIENKPELIGNTESRILFWKGALDKGIITVDDLKRAYEEKTPRSSFMQQVDGMDDYAANAKFKMVDGKDDPPDSMFGANSFAVLCASCGGNPFSEDELVDLIRHHKLPLAVFANYSIKLITPRLQKEYVRADARNLDTLIEISNQVANFKLVPDIWLGMLPTEEELAQAGENLADNGTIMKRCIRVMKAIDDANPPSKMQEAAEKIMADSAFLKYMYSAMCLGQDGFHDRFGYSAYGESPESIYGRLASILGKYPSIPLPDGLVEAHGTMMTVNCDLDPAGGRTASRASSCGSPDRSASIILKADRTIGSPRNEPLLSQYNDGIIGRILENIGRHGGGSYSLANDIADSLCALFGEERVLAIVNGGGVSIKNPLTLCALAATLSNSSDLNLIAGTAVHRYFYEPNGSKYTWEKDDDSVDYSKDTNAAIFDLLVRRPDAVEQLDWDDRRTFRAMETLVKGFSEYKMEFPKDGVERLITRFIEALRRKRSYARALWNIENRYYYYPSGCFANALTAIVRKYGIETDDVKSFYREMAECDMSDGHTALVGAWSVFEIPFEEWEDELSTYGLVFITGYVIKAPADAMEADEFITDFICSKIASGTSVDLETIIRHLSDQKYRRQKACIARTVSRKIMDNTISLDETKFDLLYEARMVTADAYRAVMGRRADRGAMEVNNSATAGNVIKAFNSVQKLDTLPELIASTVKYLVDTLYDNMGDGRFRWKVDENCREEAGMLYTLVSKLASKSTTGTIPKAIRKLFDDGLVDRIREFPVANREACDTPNKPKSKITCGAVRDITEMVDALDRVKDAAFAAADKPAKAPRRRKAAPAQ